MARGNHDTRSVRRSPAKTHLGSRGPRPRRASLHTKDSSLEIHPFRPAIDTNRTRSLRRQLPAPSTRVSHDPDTFRPCRSSRLRRFTPRSIVRVYCAPQPIMGFAEFPGHPHEARSPFPTARCPSKLSPRWQAAWPRRSLTPSDAVQARRLGLRALLRHQVRCAPQSCPCDAPDAPVGFSTFRTFVLAHRWAPHRWGSQRLEAATRTSSPGVRCSPRSTDLDLLADDRARPSEPDRLSPQPKPETVHAQRSDLLDRTPDGTRPTDTRRSTPPAIPESREPGPRNPRRDSERRPAWTDAHAPFLMSSGNGSRAEALPPWV